MKVVIYKVEGCKYCEELERKIKVAGIEANIRDAMSPSEKDFTDYLDDIFESAQYPKITVKTSNNVTYIVSNDSKRIVDSTVVKVRYYQTIDDIIQLILNTQHEI